MSDELENSSKNAINTVVLDFLYESIKIGTVKTVPI
jgi:hypothetical protein